MKYLIPLLLLSGCSTLRPHTGLPSECVCTFFTPNQVMANIRGEYFDIQNAQDDAETMLKAYQRSGMFSEDTKVSCVRIEQ